MDFEELKTKWTWTPIRNCPGRFIWRGENETLSPAELAGEAIQFQEFRVEKAKDAVIVGRFRDGGGLISYRKADGTYLHTLNTPEGFKRKLAQLAIEL